MSASRHFVITLVHGTFAPKARWLRYSSVLRKTLPGFLQPHKVTFRPFVWSGRNNEVGRFEAAKRLKVRLEKQFASYPDAEHHIVCHSHGGNVALQAISWLESGRTIDGLICLSVPFIHASVRAVPVRLRQLEILGGVLSSSATVILFIALSLRYLHLGNLATTLIGISPIAGSVLFARVLYPKLKNKASLLSHASTQRNTLNINTLILRNVGDEATGILTASHFSAWIFGMLYRTYETFTRTVYLGYLLLYLLIPVGALLGFASMALLLPFGWDLALVAILLNVTVEASPLGCRNLDLCMFPSTDTTGLVELHHGQLYENPLAIEAMSKWIEAAERRTGPA
jgi:hypothetical protein